MRLAYYFIGVILIGMILLCFLSYSKYKQTKNEVTQSSLSNQICEAELKIIRSQLVNAFKEESRVLDMTMPCITDPSNSITLSELISDLTLVYKYSSSDCSNCVNQHLEMLRELNDSNKLKTICLFEFSNPRELKSSIQSHSNKHKIFGVQGFPIKQQVFFLIDHSGRTSMYYFPNQNNEELSREYLLSIKSKF